MKPARRTTATATTATAATAVVLSTAGALLCTTAPAASAATVTCNSPVYKRQFFANTTFSGTPKRTDCDAYIAENWRANAPATGLPKDMFGVRWTLTRDFGSGGPFALTAAAQDGIRVYVDGKAQINLWKNVSSTVKKTVNLTIPSGKHTLRIDYAHWNGNANVNFAYAPRTSATIDKVKPLAPTGTSVAYDSAASKAKMTWVKNKEMDLAGYRVYRQTKGYPGWHRVSGGNSLTGTSFTDSLAPSGTPYYYEVRAVDKTGNESAGSTDQLVTTADRTPPKVSVPTATNDHLFGVSLSWDTEDSLTYDVFRATSPTGEFEKLGTSATNGATDATAPYGDTSYYRITAKDGAGNSAQSPVLAFTRPLAVPYMDSADTNEAETGVEVRWRVSKTAPAQFRLYRWERFDENAVPEQVACEPYQVSNSTYSFVQYGCADYSAVTETEYWYHVTSVDSAGRESPPSLVNSGTRTDTIAPPAVTGLTSVATEYGTVLEWEASPAADLDHYGVFRLSTVNDGTDTTYVGRVEPGSSRFVDAENLQDGETHTYFVNAVDRSGNSVRMSASDPLKVAHTTVTEYDLRPTVETPADWLVSLNARVADGATAVDLTWRLSSSYYGTDITGYRVYRWNPATAAYEPLTADPVTGTSYTDTTAGVGTTHFYWVTAVKADGTESAPGDAWAVLAPHAE